MADQAEREIVERRIDAVRGLGACLIAAMQEKIDALNLPGEPINIPSFGTASFALERDPYGGQQTLRASFIPSPHYCIGFLLFHPDGSSFAEYHVMRLHPARPAMFIEAVEAWVRDDKIRADLRLAEMPQ